MPNSSAPEPMGARRLSDGERRALRDACDGLDPDQITLRRESGDTWRDLVLFHEYFHGDDGAGLGASHQTGWTALVADLILDPPNHPRWVM